MKPIPGFDGYHATEDGLIVSTRDVAPRTLTQRSRKGYMHVTVRVCRRGRLVRDWQPVHRLVLLAYKGQPESHANQGRHLDGNCLNNRADNLDWGTHKDNAADAIRHGTLGPGMRARRRKLTEAQVMEIKVRLSGGEEDRALAREFGLSLGYPTSLARGRNWAHLPA